MYDYFHFTELSFCLAMVFPAKHTITGNESEKVFERAGYKVISSQDFNINDIK